MRVDKEDGFVCVGGGAILDQDDGCFSVDDDRIVGADDGDDDGLDGRAFVDGCDEDVADALALGEGVDVGVAVVPRAGSSVAAIFEGERALVQLKLADVRKSAFPAFASTTVRGLPRLL